MEPLQATFLFGAVIITVLVILQKNNYPNHRMTKKPKIKKDELRKMLLDWQKIDMVKAGWIYHYVEKQNDSFARGWRYAIYSVISKLDEFDL